MDSSRLVGRKGWPGVTGATVTVDISATTELALHLHPATTTTAVVSDNSDFDKYWLAAVHAELLYDHKTIREIDLVALPPEQLFVRVAVLPPQTVILFQRAPFESVQPSIGEFDSLTWVGQRLPSYCSWPVVCLNHGGIGGADFRSSELHSVTAELAKRVLFDERPEDIPIAHTSSDRIRVDWRALQRWHIPESALAAGSVIEDRELTFWERYRAYIIPVVALIVAQALLIATLLWLRARKMKAEALLRESEKRFRVLAGTTPSLVWMCDPQGKVTYLHDRRVGFTGRDPNARYGDTWTRYIHPDDRRNVGDVVSQALEDRQPFQ